MSPQALVLENLFTGSRRISFAEIRNSLGLRLSLFSQWLTRWTRPKADGKDARRSAEESSDGAACIFCQVHRPEVNQVMEENKTCYVRYDNFPAAAGHVEVVPKRHVESFFELTPRELKDAYALILTAQERLTEKHGPDGYTIGINEGRAAGRTVDHLHIHLIPRHFGDVPDPRGGIRRAVPNCDPDAWAEEPEDPEAAFKTLTEAQAGRR
ncbi:HIT family protein [Streptomyces lydicus]|uniref:HIT family protein n=1 Tax=Streptomyces lydicus TaxID=47763 RepID=UPI0037B9EB3C